VAALMSTVLNFDIQQNLGKLWLAEPLLAFEERLCCMVIFSHFSKKYVLFLA
jgi:hypothetical protein